MNVTRNDLNDIHGEAGEPNIGADVFAALTCTGGCAPRGAHCGSRRSRGVIRCDRTSLGPSR